MMSTAAFKEGKPVSTLMNQSFGTKIISEDSSPEKFKQKEQDCGSEGY